MKCLISLAALVATAIFPPPTQQATLEAAARKPLACQQINAWWPPLFPGACHKPHPTWCVTCHGPADLLLPGFWFQQSLKIEDDRMYENFDKIICSDDDEYSVCAFIMGAESEVPGYQVKALIDHLASWCDESRCGRTDLSQVEGPVQRGELKVDKVKSRGDCRGFCAPDESKSD